MLKNITILCPSSLTKDAEVKSIANHYIKQLSCSVDIIEVTTKIKPNDNDQLIKQKQGEALLKALEKIPQKTLIIALDENGKSLSSPDLSNYIADKSNQGFSSACFIIGGAFGLYDDVLKHADLKLSFGKMVWPHRLVGVMLLEQIYRAQQINSGHPYHKE